MSFGHTTAQPTQIASYHGEPIVGLVSACEGHLVASTGDTQLKVTDIAQRKVMASFPYSVQATSVEWTKVADKPANIVVGFNDGTVRIMSYGKSTASLKPCLIMLQALRPHGKRVTAIHQAPNSNIIAMASTDQTIFFFELESKGLSPIGFVNATGPVVDFVWRDNGTILVWCNNHTVCQVSLPSLDHIDTTHSFKVNEAKLSGYRFKSCKARLLRQKTKATFDQKYTVTKAKCEKALKDAQKRASERGENLSNDDINNIMGPVNDMKFEELDEYSHIPEQKANVSWAKVAQANDEFYCQMTGYDAGIIYKCKLAPITLDDKEQVAMEESEPFDAFWLDDQEPISSWIERESRVYVGYKNGRVRVFHLNDTDMYTEDMLREGGGLLHHHTIDMHDCFTGAVINLATTIDGAFLISTGKDGNMFTYELTPVSDIKISDEPKLAPLDTQTKADDIKGSYSLEEDKQKSEMDRKIREANLLKEKKRKQIKKLINDFDKLRQRNEQLPEACRLTKKQFQLNEQLRQQAEDKITQRVELIKLENQWENAKSQLQLEKIHNRFRRRTEEDSLVLHAITVDEHVASFTIDRLADEIHAEMADTRFSERSAASSRASTPTGRRDGDGTHYSDSVPSEERDNLAEQDSMLDLTRAQRKALEKKRRKAKRAQEWERLMKEMPDEKYKNPKDEEEIRVARATLGMFQLKTSSDYVVPEHMRSSTRQKRRRISMLTLQIYQKKKAFNEKVRKARDEKRDIKQHAINVTDQLGELQRHLPKHEHRSPPSIPEIQASEEPENMFTVKLDEKKDEPTQEIQRAKSASESAHSLGVKSATSLIDRTEQAEVTPETDELSEFEQFEERKKLIITLHQRDSMLQQFHSRIKRFDDDVHTLRLYKIKLEEELTISTLQLDTLLQELILLKDFEAREEAIMNRCDSKETELEDIKSKVHTSKVKLDAKQKELAKLSEREKAVQQDFLVLIGENNKFQDYLTKVFKKKIKRVTQNDGTNQDGESSDEESSDDDSDWSDEDSDAEPFDDTVCPSGCSMEMFDKTIALRQRRCEVEDEMQDTKKLADTLRKDNDSLNKKVQSRQTSPSLFFSFR